MRSICDPECTVAFEKLKESLTITPVLAVPGGLVGFMVYTDASQSRFGCVLQQGDRVIAYASH